MSIILGIDPGYDRLGVALIKKESGLPAQAGKEELLFSDCFTSSPKQKLGERLLKVGAELEKLIKKHEIDCAATEKLFFSVNQKTALAVAEARGLISYLCAKHQLPLFEYTPAEIKMTIAGYGNANKKQISEMVPRLITIAKKIKFDDEFDAIAIALTHLAIAPKK